jgi:RHS repeat-associated protein
MAQNPNPKTHNSLKREFHYYPFGMCFDVSKSPMLGKSAKPLKCMLKDYKDMEDCGDFLGDCEAAFRNYDAQIGRWLQPDPLMQHPSPYLAMSNNPVSFTDPLGLEDFELRINEIVVEAKGPIGWKDFNNVSDPFDRATQMADLVYDNGGKYRKNGEAYGEKAARYNDNQVNWTNALKNGKDGFFKDVPNSNLRSGSTYLSGLGGEVEIIRTAISKGGPSKYSSNVVLDRANRMKMNAGLRNGGRLIGTVGVLFQYKEANNDGFISPGEQLKIFVSAAIIFLPPPLSIGFVLIDMGSAMLSGKSISDRIGDGYNEMYNTIRR